MFLLCLNAPTFAANVAHMQILSAQFHKSSSKASQCPQPDRPEYAFIGRSNVGKSSLINKLCGRKALAKTSSTPGKTQLINHFDIDNLWYLVDLPGFGYAKVSKTVRATFGKLITDYISSRTNLMCLFVLLDSRIPIQDIDLVFMNTMIENGVPIALVFTKTDKLNKSQYSTNMKQYEAQLLEHWEELPPVFYTSSKSGAGADALLDFIGELNEKW